MTNESLGITLSESKNNSSFNYKVSSTTTPTPTVDDRKEFIPEHLKAQKKEYWVCPICHAKFAFEDEANRCRYRHEHSNYKVEYQRFSDIEKFPAGIVLHDLKTGEIQTYISQTEFIDQLNDLKHFRM